MYGGEVNYSEEKPEMDKKHWPPIGHKPCARCAHLFGNHQRRAGPCVVDDCDCESFLHSVPNDAGPVRVVTPAQLTDGYTTAIGVGVVVNPSVTHRDFAVIHRLDDGNYLVRDPS